MKKPLSCLLYCPIAFPSAHFSRKGLAISKGFERHLKGYICKESMNASEKKWILTEGVHGKIRRESFLQDLLFWRFSSIEIPLIISKCMEYAALLSIH